MVAHPSGYTTTFISTPNGSSVEVWDFTGDLSTSEINSLNSTTDALFPNATRIRNATYNYNCHSFAWYSMQITNQYWMNNPSVYWSEEDESYSWVAATFNNTIPQSTVQYTCKLHYVNSAGNHSAVKGANISTYVWSKWGNAGFYEHGLSDCPYYSGMACINFYR